jgi:AraC-like DNA-binding protein
MAGPRELEDTGRLQVTALGVHWVHELGYTVDRPHGMDSYVLLRFYGPMRVRTGAGLVHGESDHCLLYAPGFPQWFSGRDAGHADDHIHMHGPGVPRLIRLFRLPLNTLFRPREVEVIPSMITAVSREMHRRELFWEHAVQTLVEALLLRLGRLTDEKGGSGLRSGSLALTEVLRSIRLQVHERLDEQWTVIDMAELANLSVSRFGVLYRELFGISPMADLIDARLARARALLANTALPVGEAATRAGFRSLCYFSRLFHRRVGCAPRDYYDRERRGKGSAA